MANPVIKAMLRFNNQPVEVYKHFYEDVYVDYSDCSTKYSKSELRFR